MANRSYLYSASHVPGPLAEANGQKLIGICEWNHDIPIVFKLLISGSPKTCPSSIWNNPDDIALVGDYAAGVANLQAFLSQIKLTIAHDLITEAIEFLNKPENQSQYFVLECGEIFDMGDAPLLEQNLGLLNQVQNLQPEVEQALKLLVPPPALPSKPVSFFSKLFGSTPETIAPAPDLMDNVYSLGLGNWSNVLYFDPSSSE
jgi:hypothetical protein